MRCRTANLMTRKHRRFSAWFGILGIAFAQVAVTAHACMVRSDVSRAPMTAAMSPAHADHCAGALKGAEPLAPQGNACEVRCTDGAPSVAAPDMPPVAFLSLPVAPVLVATPTDAREWDRSVLAAASATPPPLLQFCRLLN
jgi:hypothetical protein